MNINESVKSTKTITRVKFNLKTKQLTKNAEP